ncbi:MAG: diacylglycerol kinase family protein [Saprospiraceae bacterium]|nr:diacylglycerol kinase family protein [Saprospiraceae bacterium]MCF8252782.1 diacylglycerol kinase family protein [Saprospiraceae bacterium]MCF8283173.1 diacylglycerol kinase family protein [Bacteroidales bacterium]MCF8314337.1 diacylglycerol kinase family protein [Saprospiraceae bacterium]MCF8443209.1 diacylglycerol kinase family protein [Saprospiraceae bacterium]
MLRKRLNSFRYAIAGIADMARTQANVKIHLLATVLVVIAGCYFGLTRTEWCLISLAIALVLAAEGFNTALEHLTDLVSPEYHSLAGKTKDVAAGAVLLAAIGAAAVGLLIFLPKIMALL